MSHTAESLQQAFCYLFPDEVPALKRLANMLPANPVVINIGAGSGTSGLAFLESRSDLHLVTIDIQREDSPLGCLVAEEKVLRDAGLWSDRVEHLHGNSVFWGSMWLAPDSWGNPVRQPVDMVFIDGDHSYFGCASDILAWLPNLKDGGIIAVHDYQKSKLFQHDKDYQPGKPHPKDWPGVDEAVNKLLVGIHKMILQVDSLVAFQK